jgi:hypothetical protein
MLTGGSDMDILILTSLSTTRKKLKAALDAKRVVVCGTRGTLPTESNDRPNGLPMGHAYTVFKYDETTDLIIFRNPWGNVGKFNGTDLKNGFMEMGLVDFCQNMSDIAYEDHS